MENWKKIQKFKDKFFVYSANNLFLKKEVEFDIYSRDYSYIIKGYPLLEKNSLALPKLLLLDVDGTVTNSPPENGISSNFYMGLAELNPKVHKHCSELDSILKRIMKVVYKPADLFTGMKKVFEKSKIYKAIQEIEKKWLPFFQREVKNLSKLLRECEVKKEECEEAAKIAVKKTQLVTNIFPALAELEEMGFKLGIASSGPLPAINQLARELQILSERVNASTFYFDKEGKLLEVHGYAGMNKKLLEEKSYDACIFVSDDPEADYRIASTFDLGLLVWVTDKEIEKLPGKICVKLPEIRKDFNELPKFIRRYEWARLYTWYIGPTASYELHQIIKKINSDAILCRDAKDAHDIFYYGQRIKTEVENFLNKSRPVFPEEAYRIRELLEELDLVEDIEKYKNVIVDITNRINESPLAKADEDYIRGLAEYMKEEENLGIKEWVYG
jgi:phosphoglycolate phosphatase-like HAD superfamily hydrolase